MTSRRKPVGRSNGNHKQLDRDPSTFNNEESIYFAEETWKEKKEQILPSYTVPMRVVYLQMHLCNFGSSFKYTSAFGKECKRRKCLLGFRHMKVQRYFILFVLVFLKRKL